MHSASAPASRNAGFTLVELAVTLLIFGILAGLAVPSFFSSSQSHVKQLQQMSLWVELLAEYSVNRGEVILIETDFRENRLRALSMVTLDDSDNVELSELSDPYLEAIFTFEDGVTLQDLQLVSGEKVSSDKSYVVVYPTGWVDPVTFHIRNQKREEFTGYLHPVIGRIDWREGYQERVRENS